VKEIAQRRRQHLLPKLRSPLVLSVRLLMSKYCINSESILDFVKSGETVSVPYNIFAKVFEVARAAWHQ